MNKEELIQYKELDEDILNANIKLNEKKHLFENENRELYAEIYDLKIEQDLIKDKIKDSALIDFKETGKKKLLGGIGIQVRTRLDYNESDAIVWAETNMPVAVQKKLDKRMFDNYAKGNLLSYVKRTENTIVTFPKEIKLENEVL